jgi:hypothetical protein
MAHTVTIVRLDVAAGLEGVAVMAMGLVQVPNEGRA